MSVLVFLLSAIYVLACLFLIFVVLIQKGEGGGLGALGGGGGVESAFGAKADMTWKRATFVAAGIYVCLALLLGVMPGWRAQKSVVFEQPKKELPAEKPGTPGIGDVKSETK